jgi:hypothetical protein
LRGKKTESQHFLSKILFPFLPREIHWQFFDLKNQSKKISKEVQNYFLYSQLCLLQPRKKDENNK